MKFLDSVIPNYVIFATSLLYCNANVYDWYKASPNYIPTTNDEIDIYQKPGESKASYDNRISKQYIYETRDEYEIRMKIYKYLLPDLDIWYTNNYATLKSYDYYSTEPRTIDLSADFINKKYSETDKEYYERIFAKNKDEKMTEYIRRVCKMYSNLSTIGEWPNSFITYMTPYLAPYVKTSHRAIDDTSSTPVSQEDDRKERSKKEKKKEKKLKEESGRKRNGKKGKNKKEKYEEGSENNEDIIRYDGESDEAFCNRLFQTDVPISKKLYKQKIKSLQKEFKKSKMIKILKKECKHLLVKSEDRQPKCSEANSE